MDLTEAEDLRWQEYTEELHKKDLNDPDNHNGVITHLEPDILQCEVKWALGSIITNKASGGDGIPVELFQSLKDDAVKVLHSICQQIWKTQQWPQDWKRSVLIPIPKNVQTTTQLHLSHTLAKWCSKFSKLGFDSMWTENFKLNVEKAAEPEMKLPTFVGSSKKQEKSRKTYTSASLTTLKALTVWVTTNWKITQEMGIPDHPTCLLRNLCRSGSNS